MAKKVEKEVPRPNYIVNKIHEKTGVKKFRVFDQAMLEYVQRHYPDIAKQVETK